MEFGRPISSELSKSLLNVLTPSDRNDIADELNVNPLTLHAILKRERNVSKMYYDAILHGIKNLLETIAGNKNEVIAHAKRLALTSFFNDLLDTETELAHLL